MKIEFNYKPGFILCGKVVFLISGTLHRLFSQLLCIITRGNKIPLLI